jgi:PAS domain S-box-containing protein
VTETRSLDPASGALPVSAYLEAALDCVVVADASGCVVEFNPAAERTFGYSREQALGRTLAELIVPGALRQRHSEAFERFAATGEGRLLGQRLELTGMRADGSEFPVELALSRVEGEPLLVCGALRDLTDAKRAEDDLRSHALEHAALRRVATLVANGAPPADVFAAVAEGVAELLGVPAISMVRFDRDGTASKVAGWGESAFPVGTRWALDDPSVMAHVARTGRPARIDDYATVPGRHAERIRATGIRSAIGVPITVDGGSWGVVIAFSTDPHQLAGDAEERLARFTELVATAIANSQARDDLHQLADEQAALRRVATLIAREARPAEVFAAVAKEVALMLEVPLSAVVRFEADGAATQVGAWGDENPFPVGTSWPLDEHSVSGQVARTRKPARVDDYSVIPGEIASTLAREAGIHTAVGVPVLVDGSPWGAMMALSTAARPLREGIETRLAAFTELIATAIANTQARDDLGRLAEEQAALRRVATLIAQEAEPSAVFDVVAAEVARLFAVEMTSILRYDPDGLTTKLGGSGDTNPYPVGARFPLVGVIADVWRSGGSARVDDYRSIAHPVIERMVEAGIRSSVAVPIVVNGSVWGVMVALTTASEPLPGGTEQRLGRFTELVATAIANAQARAELRQLLEEQAALRTVATLVAEGAESRGVFDAVCKETGRLFGATSVNLARFTSDGFNLTMAGWSLRDTHVPTATRLPLEGETINTIVRRTRAPARVDSYDGVEGELAELIRRRGIRSEVGAPVIVEGETWGALIAGWDSSEPSPEGTERRLASFAELIATAVSNASNRSELIASRARIVAAADQERRRIERNLHDGVQQQLVALQLELKTVEAGIPADFEPTQRDLERLQGALETVLDDVREISQGVHPATLSQWGLGPALRTLTRRSPIPVELEIDVPDRLPDSVEIAAYYFVSEALANVTKHAQASYASVEVRVSSGCLNANVRDDGIGGADTGSGSGLTGLVDRVEALGGRLSLTSAPRQGTTVTVALPLGVGAADGL